MMEESDAAVILRVRAGESDAFGVLVERHSQMLFRLAYRMTGNEQDAEDVVQESLLRAFRHLGRFDSRGSFPAWLHRIAVNCSINLLHQRPPRTEAPQAGSSPSVDALGSCAAKTAPPDHAAEQGELWQEFHAALGRLTPGERAAFVLRHFEGKSIDEIRSVLDVGTSAAKQYVFRAVQKIRWALEPWVDPNAKPGDHETSERRTTGILPLPGNG